MNGNQAEKRIPMKYVYRFRIEAGSQINQIISMREIHLMSLFADFSVVVFQNENMYNVRCILYTLSCTYYDIMYSMMMSTVDGVVTLFLYI